MSNTYAPFMPQRQSKIPLLFAGAAFVLATYLVLDRTGLFDPTASSSPRAIAPRENLAPLEERLVTLFETASPSVAHINTSSIVPTYLGVREQQGSGTGFVWDTAGTIVTNHHVVADTTEVMVTVAGQNYMADVMRSSPSHDLAILKLRGSAADLKPIALGTSEDLRVGQTAIAIGNPFGFDQTMTTGIVSALNRTLKSKDGSLMRGLIQVDAAINPGNSGGPLLDSAGRLIGVTTAIYSPSGANAGLGFAVPADVVNLIVPRLIANKPTTAKLGVLTSFDSLILDPNLGYRSGAIVTEVVKGYGALAAGLRPFKILQDGSIEQYGDVIVAVDGQIVRSFSELPRVLSSRNSGDIVEVTALRGLPDNPTTIKLDIEMRTEDQPIGTGM